MEEPTPISTAVLVGSFITRYSTNATINEVAIVESMIGSDCNPVETMTERFIPKPSRITASCNTFFEVNEIPARSGSLFLRSIAASMPIKIANTGPPTTGSHSPKSQAIAAIARQTANPGVFSFNHFISGTILIYSTVLLYHR